MGRLFSGVAQSGSWICLDEFNRIGVEVLSVIAQQLQDIKQAKIANKERFIFIDKEIALRESCGVFVTMNPTYAGRTELPDNLKVLFRPVSMMIPSYGLIAKVMLYAEGFKDAANLSDKMVQLY
jgi:dynein heavy chain